MSGNGAATLAVIIVALVVSADDLAHAHLPSARTFVALAILWVFLAILGDTVPPLAKSLAVLVVVAVLWKRGSGALEAISRAGGKAVSNG